MPYTLTGTLKLPESSKPAAGVYIKFKSKLNMSPLVLNSESVITTNSSGVYSITLEFSVYSVFVTLYDNVEIPIGEIILNSSTQTGLDLPTLLNGGQYEPATPQWILQIEKWLNQSNASASAAASSAAISASEANRAKIQADRADAAAKLASQITGLETVADAIGVASLPMPDVWAPLSDSLRLITGYGREVKVGDDVVAKMFGVSRASSATYISKDGKLKAAAANEPRFEKGGLLLEPLSTNFMATQTWTNAASAMAGRVINDDGGSDNIATINYMSGDVGFYETSVLTTCSSVPVTIGELSKYVSFEMRLSRALTGNEQLVVYETGASATGANHLISSSNCQCFVGKFARKTVMDTPPLPYQADGTNGLYMYVDGALLSDLEVKIRRVNLESLPEATSYIPTNGAAATRAADRMIGVGPGNIPHLAPFSLAVDISVTPVRGQYPIAISMGGLQVEMSEPVVGQQRILPFLNGSSNVPRLQGNDLFGGSKVLAISCDSSGMLLRYGGKTSDGNGGQIETIGDIDVSYIGVCHVRNFRIWHRALTDEQIKGIC